MTRQYPSHRVLSRARIKGVCRIEAFGPWITVEGLPLRVNHNVLTYKRMYEGTLELGMKVKLRVRHLLLDEGTTHERQVWDAHIIGDVA